MVSAMRIAAPGGCFDDGRDYTARNRVWMPTGGSCEYCHSTLRSSTEAPCLAEFRVAAHKPSIATRNTGGTEDSVAGRDDGKEIRITLSDA
uniref:Uncharacterized protein n=1 Tax=Mycena chlorophos TaxID=658473 RepID=A0ABQ0LLN6_MYCCL|nr:predicted protein [Mycena chlorophos]